MRVSLNITWLFCKDTLFVSPFSNHIKIYLAKANNFLNKFCEIWNTRVCFSREFQATRTWDYVRLINRKAFVFFGLFLHMCVCVYVCVCVCVCVCVHAYMCVCDWFHSNRYVQFGLVGYITYISRVSLTPHEIGLQQNCHPENCPLPWNFV